MASDQGYVDYIRDQAAPAVDIAYRKMFGEYALYLDGKVVALVCDNHLFVKPTADGRRAGAARYGDRAGALSARQTAFPDRRHR